MIVEVTELLGEEGGLGEMVKERRKRDVVWKKK